MRNNFTSETLEGVWLQTMRAIVLFGKIVPEDEPFLELQNLQISYRNAFEVDSFQYKKIFGTEFSDYIKRVYSPEGDAKTGRNYHNLIYKQNGVNQVGKIINILKKTPLSRSAIITLASANIEKKPCIIDVCFSVRQDLLHMTVMFKSSDFAKKFIPDMVELSRIHTEISQALYIARGSVTAMILCAQIYEKDVPVTQKEISGMKKGRYFKTDTVIENWDKEAEDWDMHVHDPDHYVNLENGYSRFIKFMENELPSINKGEEAVALDSGCGTGIISEVLNKKGYRATGIDISPKMLAFAHKDGKERQYLLANSLDIPYGNDRFDVVCSRGVLISHVGKKYVDLFISEHYRVLKPGGLLMFDFITKFKESEVKKKREKAYMSFEKIAATLKTRGFRVLKRSGEDINRVNAILCQKI